jgi:hypothetical protein
MIIKIWLFIYIILYYLIEVLTSVLLEGPARESWEASNKTILFLTPRNKLSLTSPLVSDCNNGIGN